MREITIGKNDAGQRLDRFLSKAMPLLPQALLQKYIRIKRVKCNGQRCQRDQRLLEGDVLQLYINDEFFEQPREDNLFLTLFQPKLEIVYEDENLMLLDKRPGLVVHADETEKVNTLINHIQAYLYQKREWNPRWENAFTPALCNRIDRNTGGIVIAAKNAEALRVMNEKIAAREIGKYYLCVVCGRPKPPEGALEGFIFKDAAKNRVYVRSKPEPGALKAVTYYRTLASRGGLSLGSLGTADLKPVLGDIAVEGHVLALEGRHPQPPAEKGPAKPRHQQAFARSGHGALHHDALCHHRTSLSRLSIASFSSAPRTAVRYQPGPSPA